MAKNLGVEFTSSVASGGVAHILDTATSYASGTLLSVRNNGVEKVALDGTNLTITDNSSGVGLIIERTGSPSGKYRISIAGSNSPLRWDEDVSGSFTNRMLLENGALFLNETSNANMTIGLTINQGENDDEILSLKSSDVAHGVTTFLETDTFMALLKQSGADGGVVLRAATEGEEAFEVDGWHTTDNTAKSTSALGNMVFRAAKKSGTGETAVGADGNLVVIRNTGTTRFIFDAEGSFHADVESTTFDRFDDLAVLEDMETLLAPGEVDRRFNEVLKYDRDFFEREGLFHDIRETETGVRGMMNVTRMTMLHSGAIRQVGGAVRNLERAFLHLLDNPEDRDGAIRLLEA